MVMDEDVKNRVIEEKHNLENSITKLSVFVFGDGIKSVSEESRDLMMRQLAVMKIYRDILKERLDLDERERDNG